MAGLELPDHAAATERDLLDLSRLQTGSVRPLLRPASLEEVVPLAVEPWPKC